VEWVIIGTVVAILGIAFQTIGYDRVRRWVRLGEPEPYYVSATQGRALDNDPIVGPILKAEQEAGSTTAWLLTHATAEKESRGYEYLRTKRRKIVYRSKTLAHGEELVLMVRRQQGPVLDGGEVER